MSDEHTVLFANEAFYRAFADGDFAAMDAVWSRAEAIACIHPGWAALSGREAVMESWAMVLAGAQRPRIRSTAAKAYLYGDAACVICYETVDHRGYLVATNVFVREGAAWKMVHHQAGPTAQPGPGETEVASDVVH